MLFFEYRRNIMKNLISKLLLSTLVTLGAANALYSMEESAGYNSTGA